MLEKDSVSLRGREGGAGGCGEAGRGIPAGRPGSAHVPRALGSRL